MKQIKQKYESIKCNIDKTNVRLKTQLSKKRKEEAEERIKKLNIELEELNNALEEQMKK